MVIQEDDCYHKKEVPGVSEEGGEIVIGSICNRAGLVMREVPEGFPVYYSRHSVLAETRADAAIPLSPHMTH
jgi:hypothetical protein